MMPSKIHQLGPAFIVISCVGLAVLLFYIAYCLCKRCAKIDPDSYEDQDYIKQPSSAIFKVSVCFFSSNWLFYIKFVIDDRNNFVNKFVCTKERISMSEEGCPCMSCNLLEIGEVDPQIGRCGKCGKRAANAVLDFS